jgi:hypothetical protein
MSEFLSFLALLVFIPYIIVPIIMWRKQSFAALPQLRQISENFVPKNARTFFESVEAELKKCSFERSFDALSLDYGPNIRVFFRLLISRSDSIIAVATTLIYDAAEEPLAKHVEILSRFKNGSEISTHNSELSKAPLESKKKRAFVFPKVEDPKRLFELHQGLLKKLKADTKNAYLPKTGEEFAFLVKSTKDELHAQAELGALRLDRVNNCFRPTIAGAILMAWYSMWPMTTVRRYWQIFQAKRHQRLLERSA